MPVLLLHFLKITLCSGIFLGYYWVALRNKIYHHYNRFYLLATVIISLIVPFIEFNFYHNTGIDSNGAVKILQVVTSGNEYLDEVIVTTRNHQLSATQWLELFYLSVCLILLLLLVQGLLRIRKLYKQNERIKVENVCLINTTARNTPFSFMRYIFWNSNIDMNSADGKLIFKHELVHITQNHTLDKIFINLVLIIAWCNPFFWIMRRELNMIHEFIADEQSLEEKDASAFAAMILKAAYPLQNFPITNQFFYSPLKRRLAMIIKNQHSKAGYLSRLLALPVCFFIISAFTVKTKFFTPTITPFYDGDAINVVIDAGHGGNDFGAQTWDGSYFEKDISLQLVKKIQEMNKNKKINIILSRSNDVYVSPPQRVDFTKEKKADLFISVHLGASDKKNTINSGVAVFVAKNEFSNVEKSKVLASVLISEFKTNSKLPVIANPVQRERNIWVLGANECPAVLIEAGFINNKTDLEIPQSEKGKQSIAMNILNSIEKYADSKTNFKDAAESENSNVADTFKIKAKKLVVKNNTHSSPEKWGSFEGNFQTANKDPLKMMVVFNGRKMDNRLLKSVTIHSKFAKIYTEKNTGAIEQYGKEAVNGVIVFEEAVIEKNKNPKGNTLINIDSAVVFDTVVKSSY